MGGVAGHMDHLYDNPNLTFGKMKEILNAAANAELTTEEKVDGQNLFLSYSIPEGKAKGARNKGNIRGGGLTAVELAQKFAGRGGIENAFVNGFNAFEQAVKALSDEEKQRAFGPDANIWYNAEVMDPGTGDDPNDPGSVNVIKYDDKTLKIHGVGHFLYDKQEDERKPIPEGSLETIDNALERMQDYLSKTDSKFKLARKAIIQLQKLEDEKDLELAISRINQEMRNNNLSENSTMTDYMYSRLYNGMETDLPGSLKDEIVKYLLKLPGNIGLRAIKKGLTPEDLQDLNQIIASKKMLLLQAIEPLELAIHDFAVALLKGANSVFIADTDQEVVRLRKELSDAVRAITATGADDPESMAVMQRHLNKIKDFSQITTPVEAVVFDYDGHTYKFSGNFAPLNQILGMFKFSDRQPVPLRNETNESVINFRNLLSEDEDKIKTEKAERFVMSLPKFVPTESWGDPNSMERKQIQKIFDTVGGGATISEKLAFLNKSIENPSGRIRSPRRIISTLILLESVGAIIRSFNEASAGFVFEGFLAGLLRGKQIAGRSEKGNLPIQDLIAFTELGNGREVPISLKLLNQRTSIEGSYTNLVDALDEFGEMVYIVGRKDGERIVLEKFTFNRDNFINALAMGATGKLVKEKNLFKLPGKTPEESIEILTLEDTLQGDQNWPKKYNLLQNTAGYDPKERARKERELEKQQSEEQVTITDEVPDGEDIEDTEDIEQEAPANRKEYSVEENRKLWEAYLLTESSQRQWAIHPPQLKAIAEFVDYEELGSLPYNSKQVVEVAKQYMKYLSDNLLNVFEATKELSDEITQYFTKRDRSQAISSGEEAIRSSDVIGREMAAQIAQDQGVSENKINEEVYTNNMTNSGPDSGKRIALFPGKFKPPHRGHYDFVKKVARRKDVDEVVVLISPVPKPEVNNEQSLEGVE